MSLRVALVHDWLTGMRGGEKVLEALAALWPEAPIYTLLHVPGSLSEALEAHPIRTSYLDRVPGIRRRYRSFLPLFPSAVEDLDLTSYDLIVSLSPEAQHKAVELTRTMACEVEFWPILDPTWVEGTRETRLEAYRQVRDELKRRIEARFALDLKPVP